MSRAYLNFCKLKNSQLTASVIQERCKSSIFFKTGEILMIKPSDPQIHTGYWDFKNFQFNIEKDKIGNGAFGDLYLSHHKKDNKPYAIKHISKQRVVNEGCPLAIIYQEISIQLMLNHPNIVRLYSYYENQKDIYLIEEYLPNGNLFTKIHKNKHLNEKDSFHYFIQMTNAITFLHENDFVHRDIKPENILLDENNNIKLCDFGWCVSLHQNEKRTTFCGTFEYMAPEIVCEENYDAAVDIWALGILLYEMLHGYSPFRSLEQNDEEEYKGIFRNILKMEYTIDDKLNISKECVQLIKLLLEGDSGERISAQEIYFSKWVRKFEEIERKKIYDEKVQKEKDDKKKERERKINLQNEDRDEFFKETPEEIKKKREMEKEKEKKEKEEEKEKEKEIDSQIISQEQNEEKDNDEHFDDILNFVKNKNNPKQNKNKSKKNKNKSKKNKPNDTTEKKNNFSNLNDIQPNKEQLNNEQSINEKSNIEQLNNEQSINDISNNESKKTKVSENEFNKTKSIIKDVNDGDKMENNTDNKKPNTNFNLSPFGYQELDNNVLLNTVNILESAEKVNQTQIPKDNKKAKLYNVDSFWDKIFAPFKCNKVGNKEN